MAEVKNYFQELYDVNVNDKTEKKNGLTYLSWAFAWAEIKKRHPMAFYTIYENADGWNYFTDGRTAWETDLLERAADERQDFPHLSEMLCPETEQDRSGLERGEMYKA